MKQNKVTDSTRVGWFRCIKKTGEYIDIPFCRGLGVPERKAMFDYAYMWTYNCFEGKEKDIYDYWCLYREPEKDGSFKYHDVPIFGMYVPHIDGFHGRGNPKGIKEINGVDHILAIFGIDLDTNEILLEPEEKTEGASYMSDYMKLSPYESIYDLITYDRLFPD